MENNLQTHTIPIERKSRERLAALMGFEALGEFERRLAPAHRNVRENFDAFFKSEKTVPSDPLPRDFAGLETDWSRLLSDHSFADPAASLRLLETFIPRPGLRPRLGTDDRPRPATHGRIVGALSEEASPPHS